MAYRKKTLRTMSPTARKVARLIGEIESVANRLKNLVPDFQRLDLDSQALQNRDKFALMLTDSDLWGLYSALEHCKQDGYTSDNKEWAQGIQDRIEEMRSKYSAQR